MIAVDEPALMASYEYPDAQTAYGQYPSLLTSTPMEAPWQPPACQPVMSVPTVLSTQPSSCYVDPYTMPFPQAPPVAANVAPSPAYPYAAVPPPPPPAPQAGYAVVHIIPIEQSSNVTRPPATKHQLLLDPFLQPQGEAEAWAPSSDEPSRKPQEPPNSGDQRPSAHTPHRAGPSRKVLVPGRVRADSGSASSQEGGTLETSPRHGLEELESSMDAQKVASLFRDDKTTVMLRNIPNRYTCEELLSEVIMAGFDRMFDFFYLPMDFKTKRNRGYGFINFHSAAVAKQFALAFHHRQLKLYASKKIMEVAPAVTQGYQANLSKYFEKDSDRIKNDWFRPMLFTHEAFELD